MAVFILRLQAHDRPVSLVGGNGFQRTLDRHGRDIFALGVRDEAVRPLNQNALFDLE